MIQILKPAHAGTERLLEFCAVKGMVLDVTSFPLDRLPEIVAATLKSSAAVLILPTLRSVGGIDAPNADVEAPMLEVAGSIKAKSLAAPQLPAEDRVKSFSQTPTIQRRVAGMRIQRRGASAPPLYTP